MLATTLLKPLPAAVYRYPRCLILRGNNFIVLVQVGATFARDMKASSAFLFVVLPELYKYM